MFQFNIYIYIKLDHWYYGNIDIVTIKYHKYHQKIILPVEMATFYTNAKMSVSCSTNSARTNWRVLMYKHFAFTLLAWGHQSAPHLILVF